MNSPDVITVQNLRRRYGPAGERGFEAVCGVSFTVRRGELFALLGTNGAGKTSILEVIEGLALPTAGTVQVLGHDPYRARRLVRSRVGIMLQDAGFPADLTVKETGRLWAGTLTSPRPVDEALELVDLQQRGQVSVKQLSGGEKRRLDLALALLGRPEVLFLDEPTAGLDPESRARTWRLVGRLLSSGLTLVLTTHYLAEAEQLADRVAILHHGRIVRTGTPAEVTAAQPAHISFVLPTHAPETIPDLPGAVHQDRRSGGTFMVATSDLQQTLAALLTWAGAQGVGLEGLNARPATLEEAFMSVAESGAETDSTEAAA